MNEFEFIHALREHSRTQKQSRRVIAGIGDDASVLTQLGDRDLLATTDLLLEGIDFYRDAIPPQLLGRKTLGVSLSDIAAMGGRPLWSLVSIGLPTAVWRDNFKEAFFQGYLALANQFGVTLIGGDVSQSKTEIVMDSIVLGEVASGAAVRRSGAQPGDQIFVTGTLGGAAAGLKLIQMGARLGKEGLVSLPSVSGREEKPDHEESADATIENVESKAIEQLLLRQLSPSPRVGWGIVLGEERLATAMIDISDGLSSDLRHLCDESGGGALIHASQIPANPDVATLCGRRALDPLALALHGGEDFELLFTVRPENEVRLPKRVDGVEVHQIGVITDQPGRIQIEEKSRIWDLKPGGFEHFK
jgi:thiamine-monophosphate kinase